MVSMFLGFMSNVYSRINTILMSITIAHHISKLGRGKGIPHQPRARAIIPAGPFNWKHKAAKALIFNHMLCWSICLYSYWEIFVNVKTKSNWSPHRTLLFFFKGAAHNYITIWDLIYSCKKSPALSSSKSLLHTFTHQQNISFFASLHNVAITSHSISKGTHAKSSPRSHNRFHPASSQHWNEPT